MATHTPLRVVVVPILLCLLIATHALPLGVQEAHHATFAKAAQDGVFTCLDGSRVVSLGSINDERCDCPDGSDEPGTSACASLLHTTGQLRVLPAGWNFQCASLDHVEEVPHSRINDGICDCCDGSDETKHLVECPNTCGAAAEARQRRVAEELETRRRATARLKEMTAAAQVERSRLTDEASGLEEAVALLTGRLADLAAKREPLEVREKEEAAVAEANHKVKMDAYTARMEASGIQCRGWRQTSDCDPLAARETSQDKGCEVNIIPDVSGYCECVLTPGGEEDEVVLYNFTCKHPELQCATVCATKGSAGVEEIYVRPVQPSYELEELRQLRNDMGDVQNRLQTSNSTLSSHRRILSRPLGAEDVLRTLRGQSFTMDAGEYTYELKVLTDTFQHQRGTTNGPSLGAFKSFGENTYASWAKDEYDLTRMLHDTGARCWNGVLRSTEVHVVCGADNKLARVEEPSTCHYSMVFETPAMCEDW